MRRSGSLVLGVVVDGLDCIRATVVGVDMAVSLSRPGG
jgi:hypothetical protein